MARNRQILLDRDVSLERALRAVNSQRTRSINCRGLRHNCHRRLCIDLRRLTVNYDLRTLKVIALRRDYVYRPFIFNVNEGFRDLPPKSRQHRTHQTCQSIGKFQAPGVWYRQ